MTVSAAALGVLSGQSAFAEEASRRAYVTANPATTDWLGLATQSGRYAIQLGPDPGCNGIAEGTNVLADTSGDDWTLQLEASDQVCTVVQHAWMGNVPCFKDADGEWDVDYA